MKDRHSPALVSIKDGRIIQATGIWDLEQFALLTPQNLRLQGANTRWIAGHRDVLSAGAAESAHDCVIWPWGYWYSNHYHWMVEHLPKLILIRDHGLLGDLVMPRRLQLSPLQIASAQHVGIDLNDVPRVATDIVRANHMTVVDTPDLHRQTIETLRNAFEQGADASNRRLYVSRARRGIRQISNEEEVRELLESHGFESITFEDLSFEEQLRASQQAAIIVGVHGAGLANCVFSAPGTHVVEIIDPRFPSSLYYELAGVADHPYWAVMGDPIGQDYVHRYGDVKVAVDEFDLVLRAIVDEQPRSKTSDSSVD